MKRFIIASVLILGGVLNAAADTYVFKDTQKPNGHDRSMAVKSADARTCGWTPDGRILTSEQTMERCMRSHGWAVSQYIPDPSGTDDNSVQFTDLRQGGKRGDGELHADGLKCDPKGVLSPTSRAYEQCMLGHGWRFYAYHAPTSSNTADDAEQSRINQQNSDDTSRRIDDDVRHDDEMNATINAANAAAAAVSSGQ